MACKKQTRDKNKNISPQVTRLAPVRKASGYHLTGLCLSIFLTVRAFYEFENTLLVKNTGWLRFLFKILRSKTETAHPKLAKLDFS